MYLIEITYETSTLEDFRKVYDGEIDNFKNKLAKKTFGNSKSENKYTLLISPDMQIMFAFNNRFAKYNKETDRIDFKPVEEAILEEKSEEDFFTHEKPYRPRPRRPGSSGSNTVLRYSLQGKKED